MRAQPGRKSLPWRRDPVILDRLVQVERAIWQGKTNAAIADDLGVDEKTIRNDRDRLTELQRERIKADQDVLRGQVVAELDDTSRLALESYERDIELETRTIGSLSPHKSQKAQLLDVRQKAVMNKAKVLGIIVDKIAPTDAEGKSLTLGQIRAALGVGESPG